MEYGKINIEIKLLKQNANDGNKEEEFYDFSKYVQMGVGQTLNLDDTLKTMNITLEGLPFKKKFEPTSMFRIRFTQDNEEDFVEKVYDYALQEDDVEQPNLADNTYFTHNLSLIDVGIKAQQTPVDDIAVTYKLQNVLMTTNTVDLDEKITLNINNANVDNPFLPKSNYKFGENIIGDPITSSIYYYYSGYMYEWVETTISYPQGTLSESNPATMEWNPNFFTLKNKNKNVLYDANNNNTFSFTMPTLLCYYGMPNLRTYGLAGFLPVDLVIGDLNVVTNQYTETPVITSYPSKYAKYYNDVESKLWKFESVNGNHNVENYNNVKPISTIVASGTYSDDVIVNGEIKNRQITLAIQPNHQYTFMFTRHKMQTNGYINPLVTSDEMVKFDVTGALTKGTYTYLEQNYECSMDFRINVYDPNDLLINLFKEADQTDAYYLFQKSQLANLPFRKSNGVAYYDTALPFVVSESDKTLLKKTKINESDFNGKNLWEIFSEIGKYVHAKPVVSIVTDDNDVMTGQFLVSFVRYGIPTKNYLGGTKNTIFHSKFAQEYVSALTSYVTNYFNLGSSITEYLHTSSESDDGLVYNDVVKLKTKYPILEVLKLYAYNNNNVERDITQYLFEYNIYRVLNYGADLPNKPHAIYYHLGTNLIEGMQYVEPQPTGVECAYSMKNILGRAFGLNETQIKAIQINEYYFKIVYRTKDSVRITTTRPDIRKYLLNSDIDKYPIHTQFNQQQDKLISSDAFGLNTYGKLIRTGNTTYRYTSWTNDLDGTMQEGRLYTIDNNLYYASKVERLYYADHIEEKTEFTKDFNRLSQIIGIPSEPRFYEISERNIVKREISFDDYIVLGDEPSGVRLSLMEHNAILDMFKMSSPTKYALTFLKGDGDKTYNDNSNTTLYMNLLPINTYTSKNTYTLEWDFQDNYSCGEKQTATQNTLHYALNIFSLLNHLKGTDYEQAYKIRDYVRYVDVFGRADLMDFVILKDLPSISGVSKREFINQLPEITETNLTNMSFYNKIYGSSIESVDYGLNTSTNPTTITNALNQYKSNYGGYIIAKDNREQLSFNYNIQITTNTDRIVLGNMMWNNDYDDDEYYIVFLNQEINKFSADTILEENILFKSEALTTNDLLTISHNSSGYLVYLDVEDVSEVDETSRDNSVAFAIVREPDNAGEYPLVFGKNYDMGNNNWLITFGGYNKSQAITNRKQLDDVE